MSDVDYFLIEKQPAEIRSRSIDFSNKIPAGVTIVSASLVCVVESTNKDVSDTLLASGTGTVSGDTVAFTVQGGEDDQLYKVTIEATLSSGDLLTADILIKVKER